MKEQFFRNIERYSGQNSMFVDAEQKFHSKVYNNFLIFPVWAAPKLLPTNAVNVLVFCSAWNSWNIYSTLTSFRITCFTLSSSRNKKFCRINTTKKSSAEQNPQRKVISITRVQINELLRANELWVSIPRVAIREPVTL